MNELTIASLNTFGGSLHFFDLKRRYKRLAKYFNDSNLDVIYFQEVFTYFHFQLLKNSLKNYRYFALKKSYFGPKGGLVIFSRYPLENGYYVNFSRKFVPYCGQSAVEILTQRGMLTSQIMINQKPFKLLNTHFTAVLNHDWSDKSIYFKELSSEIAQFHAILSHDRTEMTTIIAGDFNIAKGSDLYLQLVNIPFLVDPFQQDMTVTRHQEFAKENQLTHRIDYLFLYGQEDNFLVKSKKNLFIDGLQLDQSHMGFISDHMGLEVVIKID